MNTAAGTYFDGETARGHPVTLEWAGRVLRVLGEAVAAEIEVGELKVSDRLGDVPRFIYLPGNAVIETPANAFIDAVLAERPQSRGARAIHALESRHWVAVLGCFVLVAAIAALGLYGPPVLARLIARRVPVEVDQRIGAVALATLNPYFGRSALPVGERARVEKQLARLLHTPGKPPPRIEFRSMNGGLPNAFALPGNVIVVTDELVQLPAQDDEIAAVLAHELGHLERRHGLQGLLRQSFSLLIVAAVTGDVSALTSFAASIPLTILTAGYSRDLEREADYFALDLLKERGINPRAFSTVMVKLEARQQALNRTSTWISTHPATKERTAAFGEISPDDEDNLLESAWWNRALEASRAGDNEAVIVACTRVLQDEPTAAAYGLRAKAQAARGNYSEAYADGGKAIGLEPKQVDGLVALAEGAMALGKRDEAENAARKALELEPQNGGAMALVGYAEFAKGKLTEAEVDLSRAVRIAPSDSRAWAYRGLVKSRQKNYAGAQADYDQALALAPKTQWIHYDRGLVRSRQKDFAGALEDFAVVTDPARQMPDLFLERGLAEYGAGHFDRAIDDFNRGLEKRPAPAMHGTLLLRRGEAQRARGNYANALADFDAVIKMDPRSGLAYFERGSTRRLVGEHKAALVDFEQARTRGISEQLILLPRASTQWDLGDSAAAARDLDRLLEKTPSPLAHYTRGLVAFSLGDWQRANTDFEAYFARRQARQEDYAEFFRLLVRRRLAVDDQQAAFAAVMRDWPEGWAKSVGRYLTGQLSEQELLAESDGGTKPTPIQRQCEAWFYIGERHLLAGDRTGAEEFFRKCVGTGVTNFFEFKLARGELARMHGGE